MKTTEIMLAIVLLGSAAVSVADYTVTFDNRTTSYNPGINDDSLSLAVTTAVSAVSSGIGEVDAALALTGTGTLNDEFTLDLEFGFGFDATAPTYDTSDFSNPTNNRYVFRATGLSPSGNGAKFSANEMLSFTVSGLEEGQSLVLKGYELTDNAPGRTDLYYGDSLTKIETATAIMDVSASNIILNNGDQFGLGHEATGSGHRAELVGITFDVIPEPATLGMISAMGIGILWIRRRFTV